MTPQNSQGNTNGGIEGEIDRPAELPENIAAVVPKYADTYETDERARVNLGTTFGNQAVRLAVYRDTEGPINVGRFPDHTGLFRTDERGRFSVGSQFQNDRIIVVVIDAVPLDGGDGDE